MGIETIFGRGWVTSRIDDVINWGRLNSLWPYVFGTACCAIEFMSAASSHFDIARFGSELLRWSPRQSDLLIVAGTISCKQAPVLKRIYEQMCEPKWVIAVGACTCTGGLYNNYCTVQGIGSLLPVNMYVPGCPPRTEAIFDAIVKLQATIKKESSLDR
jgi:NADH-quinone oxidoreductase subunit B